MSQPDKLVFGKRAKLDVLKHRSEAELSKNLFKLCLTLTVKPRGFGGNSTKFLV